MAGPFYRRSTTRGSPMRNPAWLKARLLAGLVICAVLWSALRPSAQSGDETKQPAAKKPAPGQKAENDTKKPGSLDDVKPGPYPEDDLLPAVERGYKGSAAYRWLNVALQATAREHERHGARPTIGSRNLGIVVTAMFDAWAPYDGKAVGSRLGGKLRRPLAERTT